MSAPLWDPKQRQWVPAATVGAAALEGIDGELTDADEARQEFSRDFGGIVRSMPGAVLRPAHAKDVAVALRFCTDHGIPVVARAFGQSGHGQAQGVGALLIDLRGFNRIEAISSDGITAGAGVTWRTLLKEAVPKGLTLPIFTNHIGVSIGGSTAIGGIGIASHRYGLQADNVSAIEVATTSGKVLRCTPSQNADLFGAVLGGLGQFGFVTKLTLRPISAPTRVAMLRLAYDDMPTMLADIFQLTRENRFDTIDNRVGVQPEGGPLLSYNDVGLFLYGDEAAPDLRPLVSRTRGRVELEEVHDYATYMQRDDVYVEFISNVLVDLVRPWCTFILPQSEVEAFVTLRLAPLLSPEAGAFAFVAQPYPARVARSTTFPLPARDEEWFAVVGIVRAMPIERVEATLSEHRALFDAALRCGGTIYPYGSIPLSPADWPKIFGARWPQYAALKRQFDPRGVLNPAYGIDASRG